MGIFHFLYFDIAMSSSSSSYLIKQTNAAKTPQDFVKCHTAVQPFAYILRKKQIVIWAADKLAADKTFAELQLEYIERVQA